MKDEQEFLTAMWAAIHEKEWVAQQKKHAYALNKLLLYREIFIYGFIIALFAAGGCIAFFVKDPSGAAYIAAILLIAFSFMAEKLLDNQSKEMSVHENRNYH